MKSLLITALLLSSIVFSSVVAHESYTSETDLLSKITECVLKNSVNESVNAYVAHAARLIPGGNSAVTDEQKAELFKEAFDGLRARYLIVETEEECPIDKKIVHPFSK